MTETLQRTPPCAPGTDPYPALISIKAILVQLIVFLLILFVFRQFIQWGPVKDFLTANFEVGPRLLTIAEFVLLFLCGALTAMLAPRAPALNALIAGVINMIAFFIYTFFALGGNINNFLDHVRIDPAGTFIVMLRIIGICFLAGLLIRFIKQRRRGKA